MPLPKRVLIDTSAFWALISADHEFHKVAKHQYERLIDWEQELWTTSYVVTEISLLVHERLGFESLCALKESIQGIVKIFWIRSNIHNEAWKQLDATRGSDLTLVGWTTVLVARRLEAYLFTFEKSFAKFGIPVLPRKELNSSSPF